MFLAVLLFSTGTMKKLLDSLDALVDDVPLVGTVYEKVLTAFGKGDENALQRFVLAQLPGCTRPAS